MLRWLDRDYLVQKDPLGTGSWVRSNLSNAFSFDEDVQQVYGVLSQGYGKFDLTGPDTTVAPRQYAMSPHGGSRLSYSRSRKIWTNRSMGLS